jgi:hypothetical protein
MGCTGGCYEMNETMEYAPYSTVTSVFMYKMNMAPFLSIYLKSVTR